MFLGSFMIVLLESKNIYMFIIHYTFTTLNKFYYALLLEKIKITTKS